MNLRGDAYRCIEISTGIENNVETYYYLLNAFTTLWIANFDKDETKTSYYVYCKEEEKGR